MSGIALKMGHTTAAATGLVDRLEKLGYVQRSHALDDRRKGNGENYSERFWPRRGNS